MLRVLLLLTILFSSSFAGLLDFRKLDKIYNSYEAKDYNTTKALLQSMQQDNPADNYNLANTYYKLGNYEAAVRYYKRAFGEGVDEHNRLHNLANSYFKLKEYKKALLVYKIALKIREDKQTRYNLELTKKAMQQKKNPKKRKQNKKHKKEKSVKKSKHKSKKRAAKKKKLSQKDLKELKKLQKRLQRKKELKKMIRKSFQDKKVPVIMYPLNKESTNQLRPW